MHTDETEDLLLAVKAADWVERLATAGPKEQEAFLAWLAQSPRHVHEMLLAMSWDDLFRHIDSKREIRIDELIHSTSGNVIPMDAMRVLEGGRAEVAVPGPERSGTLRSRPTVLPFLRRAHRWAIAAALPLIVALSIGYAISMDRMLTTDAGEWQVATLADGTMVRVGPRTRLHIDFTDRQRHIRLVRGEAMFYVAKDSSRPFLVQTELATAQVVGTAFSVSHLRDSERLLVTVQEGVVAVFQPQHARETPQVRATAGQQVTVAPSAPISIKDVDLNKELAWLDGRVVLSGATVADAVREFNQRSRTRFVIAHPSVAEIPIIGVFQVTDPYPFVELLRRDGRALAVSAGDNTIVLVPGPRAAGREIGEQQEL